MGENSGLSASDVLALDNNRGDFMNGGMGAFWIFALLLLGNGGYGFGGNNGTDLAISQNAQTAILQNSNLQSQLADVRYDIAQSIGQQTDTLINQNNTNLINAIQGFNTLGLQVTNQTNVLSSQIQQLSAQLNECLKKIFYAIRNLFAINAVGTYA